MTFARESRSRYRYAFPCSVNDAIVECTSSKPVDSTSGETSTGGTGIATRSPPRERYARSGSEATVSDSRVTHRRTVVTPSAVTSSTRSPADVDTDVCPYIDVNGVT